MGKAAVEGGPRAPLGRFPGAGRCKSVFGCKDITILLCKAKGGISQPQNTGSVSCTKLSVAPPTLSTVISLLNAARRLPVQDERLQELMDGLRGKFKAAVAMLGLQEAFLTPAHEPPSLQF